MKSFHHGVQACFQLLVARLGRNAVGADSYRSETKFRSPPLARYPEFPDDGAISGFNHFIHNGRRRNAFAQIWSDSRFWHIGQNETREPKLVRADSPEGVPRKSLISGIHTPALSDHAILEILGPIAVCEVVPVIQRNARALPNSGAPRSACAARRPARPLP